AGLGTVELLGLVALHMADRGRDALLQLGKRRFGVGIFRHIRAGEPCGGLGREVAGVLHLSREGEHVGIQAVGEQGVWIDLLGFGMSGGLVEDRRQRVQDPDESGHGDVVERHVASSLSDTKWKDVWRGVLVTCAVSSTGAKLNAITLMSFRLARR